jgi:hypothetical protein
MMVDLETNEHASEPVRLHLLLAGWTMKPILTGAKLTPARAPAMARTVVIGDSRSRTDIACLTMVMGWLLRVRNTGK